MDTIRSLDHRICRGLGRLLWRWQERLGFDTHTLAFALVGLAYVLIWRWLCIFEHHPEWMWYLLGPGLGAVASFVADHDPVALLDRHVALTRAGAEPRWSLLRLLYPLIALVLLVQVVLTGEHSALFCALLGLEMALFALLEYLLAIRLVAADHELVQTAQRLGEMLAAALAQAGPGGAKPPESDPEAEPTPPADDES